MINDNTVVVNGLETRYLSGGPDDAPVVVFLHDGAWGASSDVTWGEVAALAATDYRVVAPDLLGFGGSAKSVRLDQSPFAFRTTHLFALLDHLGITGPVHLVGNSFGGSIALRALTDPVLAERISSVTAISGTGGPWRTKESAQLGAFDGTEADLQRIVELLCDPYPGLQAQVAARYRWASMPGNYAATVAPHAAVPEPLRVERPADPYPANLAAATAPVLLFECTGDPLVEAGWTKHLQDILQDVTVAEVPYRHAPNITHPHETWEIIAAFLKDTDAAE
ncbi:alpha/beta fold hydrolase [Flexivirga alba]|uniref:Alpha/beta fold hydrolase n=1 Tax=Flexivirga alba TaxID=702742 RepID=A0ABW2AKH6_9MICO